MIRFISICVLIISFVFLVTFYLNECIEKETSELALYEQMECEEAKLLDLAWKQMVYSDPKFSPYVEDINRASLRWNEAGLSKPLDVCSNNAKPAINKREAFHQEVYMKFQKLWLLLLIIVFGSIFLTYRFLRS